MRCFQQPFDLIRYSQRMIRGFYSGFTFCVYYFVFFHDPYQWFDRIRIVLIYQLGFWVGFHQSMVNNSS